MKEAVQALRESVNELEDPKQRVLRQIELLETREPASLEAVLGNPYWEKVRFFDPGDVPPECPWQLGPFESLGAWLDALWAPLTTDHQHFLDVLKKTCKGLAACLSEGRWEMAYALYRDPDDESVPGRMHEDYCEPFVTWYGGPPNAEATLSQELLDAGWTLPESLAQFYAIHDGFGPSSHGVGAIEPAANLELLSPERPECLVFYCNSVGHRRLFWRNLLEQEQRKPLLTFDWDRDTHELTTARTFPDFLEVDLASDMRAQDIHSNPYLSTSYISLTQHEQLALYWSDLPLGSELIGDTGELRYAHGEEVEIEYGQQSDVQALARRWCGAFVVGGWSLEAQASLLPERHAELRLSKGPGKVVELCVERRKEKVFLSFGREKSDPDELESAGWLEHPLPLDGAVPRTTGDYPANHATIGYPLARLAEIRERWIEAFGEEEWEVQELHEELLHFASDEQLWVYLRQEPLGVEVVVYDEWGQPMPEAFSFLRGCQFGPLTGIDRELDTEILNVLWMFSGAALHYGWTRAEMAFDRWVDVFESVGFSVLQRFRGSLGPQAWLYDDASGRWVNLSLYHEDEYDAVFYVRHFEGQAGPYRWAHVLPEHEGFWLDIDGDVWCIPWPAKDGSLVDHDEAKEALRSKVRAAFIKAGWMRDVSSEYDDQHHFFRGHHKLQISFRCESDGDWVQASFQFIDSTPTT